MTARLVECSDHDVQYGILTVERISIEAVQNKIYEIKSRFCEENFDDWTLDDLFEQFPEEWEWGYMQTTYADVIEV